MKIVYQEEITPELISLMKIYWHSVDLKPVTEDFGWLTETMVILAYEDDQKLPVGVVYARNDAGVIYLDTIIVELNHEGKGIGHALLTELEKKAKEKNAHKIYLHTRNEWEAVKLYEEFEYKKTADLPNHYLKLDWVEYTKFLS